MKKVVIAIDSFKGSLSSMEAAKAAERGVHQVYPESEVICLPISDGGEGLLHALMNTTESHQVSIDAHGPLMEIREAQYGIANNGKTAFIEMAVISGLPLVPLQQRNPMITTSFGTGELIKDALDRGCRDFIIGIGGSATNDAGLGMLQALSYRFLDKGGEALGVGGQIMEKVSRIDASNVHPKLQESQFTIACDVNNPFQGPNGAAYIFAPQKGASPDMVQQLDRGMQSLSKVIQTSTGVDVSNHPGAGAAGGIGGAFLAFMQATLKSGIDLLLDFMDFENRIQGADLIITGEGRVDQQTMMGKVPFGIMKRAQKYNIPVIVIAGSMEDVEKMNQVGFQSVYSIVPGPIPLEKSMESEYAKANISRLVAQISYTIQSFYSC